MRENLKRRLDTIQKNIWLTFLGVVAALAIALSVFYFFKMRDMRLKRVANDDVYKQQLENHYQMSLFRLCDSTKNADANLSKLAVSNSPRRAAGAAAQNSERSGHRAERYFGVAS